MFEFLQIPCLKCGFYMSLDVGETSLDYMRNVNDLLDKDGKLVESSVPEYLIFRCFKCSATKKVSITEFVTSIRNEIINNVLRAKEKQYISENLLPSELRDDKWVVCGLCEGLDGNGSCPQHFYNRCMIRRSKSV